MFHSKENNNKHPQTEEKMVRVQVKFNLFLPGDQGLQHRLENIVN